MRHIYEKDFRYVPSGSTDLKETFARVRERQEKEAKEKAKVVTEIKPRVKGRV